MSKFCICLYIKPSKLEYDSLVVRYSPPQLHSKDSTLIQHLHWTCVDFHFHHICSYQQLSRASLCCPRLP